jgi:uncharacterized protein with HEPN domain
MSDRSQELFLLDIIESVDAIHSFVNGCDFSFFCNDRKTFSATIRELEILRRNLTTRHVRPKNLVCHRDHRGKANP